MSAPLTAKEIIIASGNYPQWTDEDLLKERKDLMAGTKTGRVIGFVVIAIGFICLMIGSHICDLNGKETDLGAGLMWVMPFAVAGGAALVAFAREPRQSHIEHELARRGVDYTSKIGS